MIKTKRSALAWHPEYRDKIDEIRNSLVGFGANPGTPTSTELFLLFLSFGYNSGVRIELVGRINDGPRLEYINETQMALIKAVGLAESESADVLLEEDQVFTVVEEIAAGGQMLIYQAMKSERGFQDWLRTKLAEFMREMPEIELPQEAL